MYLSIYVCIYVQVVLCCVVSPRECEGGYISINRTIKQMQASKQQQRHNGERGKNQKHDNNDDVTIA